MHDDVKNFVRSISSRLQCARLAVEMGARDINGSVRDIFPRECIIFGVDGIEGKGVDFVGLCHDFLRAREEVFDVTFSTEMLEHDPYWEKSMNAMFRLLKPGGLIFVTCATDGRSEHGVKEYSPTGEAHYHNIEPATFQRWIDGLKWREKDLAVITRGTPGLQFWGIKHAKT